MTALDAQSSFEDREIENLDLTGQRLADKEFEGCSFVSCKLHGLLLDRCRFVSCEFRSCDLSLIEPRDSSFRGVRFIDSRLTGVNWTQADTTLGLDVAFERSVLDGGSFMELPLDGLEVIGCRAQGVSFSGASLLDADFSGSDLLDSQFHGSDLRGADLSAASNVTFDPRECRLGNTKLSLDGGLRVLGRVGIVIDGNPDLEGTAADGS